MAETSGLTEFQKLLTAGGRADLGPGPRATAMPQAELDKALGQLFGRSSLEPAVQALLRSLMLLWHDHLDAAHTIAQSIESADGSFLHGIMHRREPDYGNAAYWFRRTGAHVCFPEIAGRVTGLLDSRNEIIIRKQLLSGGKWAPFAFIDLCETAAGEGLNNPRTKLLQEIQAIESAVLLEHFLSP